MNTLRWTTVSRAAALALAALVAVVLAMTLTPLTPTASAYYLGDGCSEYDPGRGIEYRCVPSRTAFYTPDGVDPSRVSMGTGYAGESSSWGYTTDTGGYGYIPPPAPFRDYRFYCSRPWWGSSPYEGRWNYACYRHDVCYGSQLGRKYCDVRFWNEMIGACKRDAWYNPSRYTCYANARVWYYAVRWYGASHYKPRRSSSEPAGVPR